MSNDLQERATNISFLKDRLDFNQKYSRLDFQQWLCRHLDQIKFESVLDIACGTGKQTSWFARKIIPNGKVCAFDKSADSIEKIKLLSIEFQNIEACIGSMDELYNCVSNNFSIKQFDLAHCSYALYYAKNPHETIQQILQVLAKDGTLALSGPHLVNTLLVFLSQYQDIPQASWDCLEFMNDIVLFNCYRYFNTVRTHIFVNNMYITSLEDFAEYYRASTFYSVEAERKILNDVNDIINKKGSFHIQKNTKLVIASLKAE